MEENISVYTSEKEFIPIAPQALTFSIWGNALSFLFFIPILGIGACITGLILSIIGLRKGREGMEIYRNNKQKYYSGSFAKALVGFILGIVGIVQAALMSIYAVVFTALMGEIFR